MQWRNGKATERAKSRRNPREKAGFTLIEIILVMTILTIAISVAAPSLAHFFRGRTLDSEARRMLALLRHGQSRAVSEGLPIEVWFDSKQSTFGMEAEPSYDPVDPKAVDFTLDQGLQMEITEANPASIAVNLSPNSSTLPEVIHSNHPNLPRIRFLPDGSIAETSPAMIRLTGRDGDTLWIAQARNRLNYEVRTSNN